MKSYFALAAVGVLAAAAAQAGGYPTAQPLERAHAHNDYEHARPLFDALDHGFTSVEADIYLVDGELLIAHDPEDLDKARTLRGLYLDPLRKLAVENVGSIYPEKTPFRLLIDVKTDAEPTWAALRDVLADYSDILTRFSAAGAQEGAVTVIVSGNRARETMMAEDVRLAAYDGRPDDVDGDAPATFIPLISGNWTNLFKWQGEGEMPADERARLDKIVGTVHGDDRSLRFWATPDQPGPARDAMWSMLIDADVDLINTDDLAGLETFLLTHDPDEIAQASARMKTN